MHTFVLWWRSFTIKKHVDDSHISCLRVNENLLIKFQWQGTHLLTYLLKNILKDLDENDTVLIPRIVGGQSPEKGNHFILWVCVDKKINFCSTVVTLVKAVSVYVVKVLDGLLNRIRVYDPTGNYKSISAMDLAILWYYVLCKC